jgi:hypothetical protein
MSYLQAIDKELDHKKKVSDYVKDKGNQVMKMAISYLCINDPMSSSFYGQEERPSEDCYCDNCFHGNHQLAKVILEQLKLLRGPF